MSESSTLQAEPRTVSRRTLNVPLNRVEGDLEIRVELEQGRVADAWSSGTMFRGIENILRGRGALDGLVITPRVCGICGTAHLMAAARALDAIAGVTPPPDAVRVRNLALMTEHLQSDVRHGILMFMSDFCNPRYQSHPLYQEACRRYEPFKGASTLETIRKTKSILEVVAILGGQWPHSSYMVPGGVTTTLELSDLLQCRHLLTSYKLWYERQILGCSLQRWQAVDSAGGLEAWLDECAAHQESDLGFYLRLARQLGLDQIGRGCGNFISFGALDHPEEADPRTPGVDPALLIPAGFARGTRVEAFDQQQVAEHVAHSWYEDYEGGRHPFEGETRPYATGWETAKYSWAKAPRYVGLPAETGPLAEMVIAGHPLFVDLIDQEGPSVFGRQLARLVRPATLIPTMERWLAELSTDRTLYVPAPELIEGQGFGLTQASRGALGHWVKIAGGKLEHYQIITPTAWHASPRDSDNVRGPWEEALVGTPVEDPENPVELGHVVRSFDACLVCTVHAVGSHGTSVFRQP